MPEGGEGTVGQGESGDAGAGLAVDGDEAAGGVQGAAIGGGLQVLDDVLLAGDGLDVGGPGEWLAGGGVEGGQVVAGEFLRVAGVGAGWADGGEGAAGVDGVADHLDVPDGAVGLPGRQRISGHGGRLPGRRRGIGHDGRCRGEGGRRQDG